MGVSMRGNSYSENLKQDAINYLKKTFSFEDLKNELSFRRIKVIRTQIRKMNQKIEELAEEVSTLDRQVLGKLRNVVLQADGDQMGNLSLEILESALSDLQGEQS